MNRLLKSALLAATVMTPGGVLAQNADTASDGADTAPGDDVIIVTARKNEELLAETPISITAFSEADIENAGFEDVRDIADLTPGLQFNGDFGRTAERPVVRGIANLRPETAQPVSLFVDGVYVRTGVVSTVLDNIARVEVLKGPQAALYGRSTYGGVINYVTRQPDDELDIRANFTIAEYDSYEATGIISGPLSDGIYAQAGARYATYGGSYDNVSDFSDGAREVGEEETLSIFGTLRFNPDDNFDLSFSGYYSEDSDGQFAGVLFDSTNNNSGPAGGTACPEVLIPYYCGVVQEADQVRIATSVNQGADITPSGLTTSQIAQWDFRAGLDREIVRGTMNLSYDISDSINLAILGGYTEEDLRIVTNQSYSDVIVSNSFGSFPSFWVTDDVTKRDYWTAEGRLSGSFGDGIFVNWLAGVFHYQEDVSQVDRNISEADLAFDFVRENDETSVFGSLEFEFTPEFSVGFEGRYSWEDVTSINTEGGRPLMASFKGFNPRVTIDYAPTDNSLIYASLSRGTKAGGFNDVNPDDPDELPFLVFNEEKVWQYEIGFRSTFLDDLLSLDVAAFRLDLTDQQLSQVVILNEGTEDQVQVTVVQNVGESRVNGLEVDLGLYPADDLSFRFTYALADTKVLEGTDAQQARNFGDPSFAGSDIPRVAENSFTATAQYEPDFNDEWRGLLRLDGIFSESRFAQIHNLQETGDSFRLNARIGIRNDNWEFSVFARNLLDDQTSANVFRYVDPGDFRFFRRAYASFLPRRSQFGANVRFNY